MPTRDIWGHNEVADIRCPELSKEIARAERTLKSPLCHSIDQKLNGLDTRGIYTALETHNKRTVLPVPPVFVESLERLPECETRKRTLLVYYESGAVKSFFFCLRVQENPEDRVASVEYMESVPRIVPKVLRTTVYHTILGCYLNDVRNRGYTHVYLRAEPPDMGEDYIFPGCWSARAHTSTDPDYEYLCAWYEKTFESFQGDFLGEGQVLDRFTVMFSHVETLEDLKQLPVMDGDTCLQDVLEDVTRSSRVRGPERYAELFRTSMEMKFRQRPYPEIYYTLFLAPAPAQRLRIRDWQPEEDPPENMTATRKGIFHFCDKHGLTFGTPEMATKASQAMRRDLYLNIISTHVDACPSKCCTKFKENRDQLWALCCEVVGYYSVDDLSGWLSNVKLDSAKANKSTRQKNTEDIENIGAGNSKKASKKATCLSESEEEDQAVPDGSETPYSPPRTRSKAETIATRVTRRRALQPRDPNQVPA
eukprot:comp19788_c0_seq1/m.23741 comp19788_c0_seq1/g.23741  ORF comp19788_c0_seq1/g.23741 comp19788_c0_seq1/m.23741 type:complete len:479 (-) comp19788_c0_seq1:623-2059(-)